MLPALSRGHARVLQRLRDWKAWAPREKQWRWRLDRLGCRSMRGLNGLRVLVTGASSGIGEAVALRLGAEGCRVGLVARRGALLEDLAQRIREAGGEALAVPGDLCTVGFAAECAKTCAAGLGGLDAIVSNAGTASVRPVMALREAEPRETFDLNVFPTFALVKAAIGALSRSSNASVLLMSSVAGLVGTAGQSVYSASKAALIGLGRSLALELAPRRVRCNVICPGFIETELTTRAFGKLSAEQLESIRLSHPLGTGTPADVAGVVAFLLSEDARWLTGAVLPVDGGFSAH